MHKDDTDAFIHKNTHQESVEFGHVWRAVDVAAATAAVAVVVVVVVAVVVVVVVAVVVAVDLAVAAGDLVARRNACHVIAFDQ
jgi:hypothetical protein